MSQNLSSAAGVIGPLKVNNKLQVQKCCAVFLSNMRGLKLLKICSGPSKFYFKSNWKNVSASMG